MQFVNATPGEAGRPICKRCLAAASDDAGATSLDGVLLCRQFMLVTLNFLGRPFLSGDLGSDGVEETEEMDLADTVLNDDDVRDIVE
jgi:hypothetical protein